MWVDVKVVRLGAKRPAAHTDGAGVGRKDAAQRRDETPIPREHIDGEGEGEQRGAGC